MRRACDTAGPDRGSHTQQHETVNADNTAHVTAHNGARDVWELQLKWETPFTRGSRRVLAAQPAVPAAPARQRCSRNMHFLPMQIVRLH